MKPRGTITVVGFDKSRWGTATLVAWLTRYGYLCYGEVAANHPRGSYHIVGTPAGLSSPGPPLLFGKPIFMAGYGFDVAFGIARNMTSVQVTIGGKVTKAQVRPLAGGVAAGVYAFLFRGGLSTDEITSVVGLDAVGSSPHHSARPRLFRSSWTRLLPCCHASSYLDSAKSCRVRGC